MSKSSYQYNTDPQFLAELPLYKTAYSTMLECEVTILHTVVDFEDGHRLFGSVHVDDIPDVHKVWFRVDELTDFRL
jgi:hypothetical protein